MTIRDEDSGAALASIEGDDGVWLPSTAAVVSEPRDGQSLYEQARACAETERARADAAEARVQELLNDVRRLRTSLRKAEAGKGASGPVPRNTRGAHQAPASKARNDTSGRRSQEIRGLHRALERSQEQAQGQKDTNEALRAELRGSRKEAVRLNKEAVRLNKEVARLKGEVAALSEQASASASLTDTNKALRAENVALQKAARASERRCKRLAGENAGLHSALCNSHERELRLDAWHRDEVDGLNREIDRRNAFCVEASRERRAMLAPLRRRIAQLRAATARAKGLVESLRQRNARLRTEVRELRAKGAALEAETATLTSRVETLESRVEKLRSTRSVLSKALFGSRSEKQKKAGTGRTRGQQPGAPGHGRTQRAGLREKEERRNPPKDARVCSCCGKPYVANGEHSTNVIEIEVKAHIRRIVRPRWRRGCECPSSPLEAIAPPAARLFPGTLYGTSFWARFLFEHCACFRPLSRVAAWYADQGLPVSPGTLADSQKRFVPLFEPIHEAILAHQNKAALRHADETGWRVQEFRRNGRSSRAWLWTSVSRDTVYFLIDPSRSAEVAKTLFGDTACTVLVVCDRFSAYRKLARELDGKVILCFCWAHQRRTFIDCAAGHVRLTRWCERWIERIGEIYNLNDERLKHYDASLERRTPAFDAAQDALRKAVEGLFADAGAELAGLPKKGRKAKALRSLLRHREGLCVFVDHPLVPMDNNTAERVLRGPSIGRKLSFGSNSEDGATFIAIMYSVVGTLSMNGIDVLRWLKAWLDACAKNGGKPPDDLSPWLPWSMSEARKRKFTAPG